MTRVTLDELTPELRAAVEKGVGISQAIATVEAEAFRQGFQLAYSLARDKKFDPTLPITVRLGKSRATVSVTPALPPPPKRPRRYTATDPDGRVTTIEAVEG